MGEGLPYEWPHQGQCGEQKDLQCTPQHLTGATVASTETFSAAVFWGWNTRKHQNQIAKEIFYLLPTTLVWIAPKSICWKSNAQDDGMLRWGSGKVTRLWVQSPREWDQCPHRRGMPASPTAKGHSEEKAVPKWEAALPRHWVCQALSLGLSSLYNYETYVSGVYRLLSLWNFVTEAWVHQNTIHKSFASRSLYFPSRGSYWNFIFLSMIQDSYSFW